MIDEKLIKRFIKGAREAFKEVEDPTFTFPMNILSAYELATSIEKLLKEQETIKPIYDEEKYGDHLPHCGNCEKVLPNNAVYGKTNFCLHCGRAVKWE